MSKQLITEFTKVLPKILLIGDDSDLALKITAQLRENNFKVVYRSSTRLLSDEQAAASFAQNTYYKIIYLFNLKDNTQPLRVPSQILRWRHEPILIITRFDTTTNLDSPLTHQWFQNCLTQYNNITALAQRFPKASLLIARDLILTDSAFHPAASYFFSRLGAGEILSPGFAFSFISQNSFLEQARTLLFAPYTGEKMLFATNQIAAASIFHAFADVWSPKLKLVTETLPIADFEFDFSLTLYSGVSDLNFVTSENVFFKKLLTPPTPTPQQSPPREEVSLPPLPHLPTPPVAVSAKTKHILQRARKILTTKEESFLSRYLDGANTPFTRKNIDLRSFDFLQSAVKPVPPATFSPKPPPRADHRRVQINFDLSYFATRAPIIAPISPQRNLATIKVPQQTSARASKPKTELAKQTYLKGRASRPTAPTTTRRQQTRLTRSRPRSPIGRHFFASPLARAVAGGTLILALVVLGYTVFYHPTIRRAATQSALRTFFTTCHAQAACLTNTDLSHELTSLTSAPVNEQALIGLLSEFLPATQKFDKQLIRALGVAWQNQPGVLTDEWQIVAQSLTLVQETLTPLQAELVRQENYLVTLTDLTTINDFKERLDVLNNNLQLLRRHLPLLEALAAEDELAASVLMFDNTIARSGGGEVLGYVQVELQKGKLGAVSAQPLSEIIAAANLEISSPPTLQDYRDTALEATGAYNLAFGRDFNATSALAAQLWTSAGGKQVDLSAGLNLNTLAALEAVVNKKDAGAVLATLRGDLRSVTIGSKEKTLISHLNTLHAGLARLSGEQLKLMFFSFLNQLNTGEMSLSSPRDDLALAFAGVGVTGDPSNVLCPAGFGTDLCFLDIFVQTDDYLDLNVDLVQTVTHTIELELERTRHMRQIILDNRAGKRPAADYLTFSLPVGAKLESLEVDGEAVTLDTNKGLRVVVEAGQALTIEVTAMLERTINKNDLTYSFYNQGQSGLLDQSIQVIVVNKLPYSPKIIAPAAVNEQKNIIFNPVSGQSFQGAVIF
jgi:hypothetical protein